MTNGTNNYRRRIELRRVDPDQIIYDLLHGNGLPTADLDTADIRLYEASLDEKLVGVGGFELYGTNALLRSVVVSSDVRGKGFGTIICLKLEDIITEAMCSAIYLLTTDATGFFEQLGYKSIDCASAPEAIRSSRQFTDLCPSTAECMVKTL